MKQVITFILQKGQQLDNFMSKFFPKYWEEIGTSAGGLANYVNNQANAETYTNNKNGYTLTLSSVQGINSATDFYALHESIRSKANPLNNLSTSRAKKLSQGSAVLGLVQVSVSVTGRINDDNEFTGVLSDSDIGELLTVAAAGLTFAGAPLAAAIALTAGLTYTIYNVVTGDAITFEELRYGYHHDIFWAFVDNQATKQREKDIYEDLILGVGADYTAKWIMEAYGSKKAQELIQETTYANYQEKLSEFYYNRDKDDKNKKTEPLNNLQITLLNKSASEVLHQIKNADADTATAMLYALQNLNPIAISKPDDNLRQELDKIKQNLAQYSDEWIQLRSLMLLEKLKIQSKQRKDNLLVEVLNPIDISAAEDNLEHLISISRASLGISENEGIIFSGYSANKELQTVITHVGSVSAENKHRVEFGYLGDVIGGNQKDWLFGTNEYGDTIIGHGGNDILLAGKGDDTLIGGTGTDKLNGGDGFDTYVFNSASEAESDRIIDSDGNGMITIAGKNISDFNFKKAGNHNWVDYNNGWKVASIENGNLHFLSTTGSGSFVVENWQYMGGNQLGIVLPDINDERPSDGKKILLGDWHPQIDSSGNYKTDQWYKRNANGGIINGVEAENFNDIIQADNVDTIIKGLGGHDALSGGTGNDIIEGGDGSDMLLGGGGEDTIRGGDGNDFINASGVLGYRHRLRPDDTWVGKTGTQYKILSATHNSLVGVYEIVADNVVVFDGTRSVGDEFGDTIFGGNGDDMVFGSNHDDNIHGDGHRLSDDKKEIVHESGHDFLSGRGGHDTIHGGLGNDTIWGDYSHKMRHSQQNEQGMDMLYGDEGDDDIYGGGKDDILVGGDGNDTLNGDASIQVVAEQYHGNDALYGGKGNDRLAGQGGHDILDGGEGNDTLWGDDNHHLTGQYHGNDTLYGGMGNDFLIGNGGNDFLAAGDGDDELRGDDAHTELDGQYHGNDMLYGESGNDTIVGDGQDDILDGGDGDDKLRGDDVHTILGGQYHGHDMLYGKSGNDTIIGDGQDDILDGGDGDDVLWGDDLDLDAQYHGNDTLYGGQGNDNMLGHGGDDVLYGGSGNDLMWGDNGETTVSAFVGTNHLYGEEGNDELYGGVGVDYLSGGIGTDILMGNMGEDTLFGDEGNDFVFGNGGNDVLFGGAGNDEIYGDEAEIYTQDWTQSFDDILYGNEGNDVLVGGSGSDVLYGGVGNDTLYAGTGILQDDKQRFVLSKLVGRDILYGGLGDDALYGEDADVILYGDDGNDKLRSLSGNDKLYGGSGNDTLVSGSGKDYLYGGEGVDVYSYKHHDAITIIDDVQDKSIIVLDSLDDLQIESNEKGIVIYNGIDGDELHLIGHTINPNHDTQLAFTTLEYVNQSDKHLSLHDLLQKQYENTVNMVLNGGFGNDTLHGRAGDDVLDGGFGNDILRGGNGHDRLNGGFGDDVLIGGKGNDTLNGDFGNDTYIFNLGDGQDTIQEMYGNDKLKINGLRLSDVLFMNDGRNLIIASKINSDRITLENHYFFPNNKPALTGSAASINKIETFEFEGGQVLSYTQVENMARHIDEFKTYGVIY